jgi:uncharacterized membrane protein
MYYLSFPVIAWIGGGYYMIAATCVLVFVLRQVDFNLEDKPGRRSANDTAQDIIEMSEKSDD